MYVSLETQYVYQSAAARIKWNNVCVEETIFPSLATPCDPSNRNWPLRSTREPAINLLVTVILAFPQERGDLAVLWIQLERVRPLLRTAWGWGVWTGCSYLSGSQAFGGTYVLFRREEITLWPRVQVAFFSALPVIKLISDSCVYFLKGKGLRREAAQIIYCIHYPQTMMTST